MIVKGTERRVARWRDWTVGRMLEEVGRQYGNEPELVEKLKAMMPELDEEAARHAFLIRAGVKRGVPYYALYGMALGRYARTGLLPEGLKKQGMLFVD